MDKKEYSVSEAVRLVGVESHVLRYWEEELQIGIQRSAHGHRIYTEENIAVFRRVKNLKEKGIQLKAIRVLLAEAGAADCALAQKIRTIECRNAETGPEVQPAQEQDGGPAAQPIQGQNGGPAAQTAQEQDGEPAYSAEDLSYEIVFDEKKENLRRFEAILRRMIGEVMEEQNEKLEQELADVIREEMEELYLQTYRSAAQEAAAGRQYSGELHGLRRLLKKYFGRK